MPIAPLDEWPEARAQHPRYLVAAARRRREDLPKLAETRIRYTLLFVEEFRTLCELRSKPARMIEVLWAAIESGKAALDLATKLRADGPHREQDACEEDEARCMRDLESLLRALRLNAPLPVHEFEHAMDALIMECVKIDAVASEARSSRRRLPRTPIAG